MNIEINDLNQDTLLSGEFFRFQLFETTLVLEDYYNWSKPTKRHNPIIKNRYCRLNQRVSDLKEADVQIPIHVKQQAETKLKEMIKVVKWSEYKKGI